MVNLERTCVLLFYYFLYFEVNLDLEKTNQLGESSPNFIFTVVNLDPIILEMRWINGESWPNDFDGNVNRGEDLRWVGSRCPLTRALGEVTLSSTAREWTSLVTQISYKQNVAAKHGSSKPLIDQWAVTTRIVNKRTRILASDQVALWDMWQWSILNFSPQAVCNCSGLYAVPQPYSVYLWTRDWCFSCSWISVLSDRLNSVLFT